MYQKLIDVRSPRIANICTHNDRAFYKLRFVSRIVKNDKRQKIYWNNTGICTHWSWFLYIAYQKNDKHHEIYPQLNIKQYMFTSNIKTANMLD